MRVKFKDLDWFEKNAFKDASGDYFENGSSVGPEFAKAMFPLCGKEVKTEDLAWRLAPWMYDVVEEKQEEKQEEIQKPKRKVISMIPFVFTRNKDYRADYAYAVLCDDGSMWERWGNSWTRLSDIPQD